MGHHRNTKVAEQQFIVTAQQHILWLDIAMDQLFVMCILQRPGSLFKIRERDIQRQARSLWVTLTYSAIGGVTHHEKRGIILHIKIEDADNMRMLQTSNNARFC